MPSISMENVDQIIRKLPANYKYQIATPHSAVIMKPISFPAVDLRPVINQLGLKIRSQVGGVPCAVHAFTFLLEYQYVRRVFSDLSEEYLQYVTFQVEKPQMHGGENFWALNVGYQKWGAVPQAFAPNQDQIPASIPGSIMDMGKSGMRLTQKFIKNWDPSIGATQDQLDRVIKYLDQDTPVGIGLLWPKNFKTHVVGGVDLMEVPSAADKWSVVFDGHAVALVGYQTGPVFPGNGYFVFRNSWGETFGDHGYGYMPFDYVLKYANDLCVFSLPNV